MKGRLCAIDTSCVIALDALDLLPKLSFLFSRVLLPKGVRVELFRRRRTKDRLQALLRTYAFLEVCDQYDQGAVDVLLIERTRLLLEDRGEAEAVVQAASIGAIVIADDEWGRALAAQYHLECHGTLWMLRQMFDVGLVSSPSLREGIFTLLRLGIRLPRAGIESLLQEIGAPPIELL